MLNRNITFNIFRLKKNITFDTFRPNKNKNIPFILNKNNVASHKILLHKIKVTMILIQINIHYKQQN